MERHVIEAVGSWDEPGLAGCRLKLARATELLSSLQHEEMEFRMDGKLVQVMEQLEKDDLGNNWAVVYCESVKEIPMRFSLLAGDCVHNLRSALDHAICCLVERDGAKPTRSNQWPMLSKKPETKDEQNRYDRYLEGITDADARKMIDWFQPYQRPTNMIRQGLRQLHDLDIIDKHRLVRPGVAILAAAEPSPHVLISPGDVKPGNELFRVAEAAGISESAILYQLGFWEDRVTPKHLSELRRIVGGVINKVSVFFGPAS